MLFYRNGVSLEYVSLNRILRDVASSHTIVPAKLMKPRSQRVSGDSAGGGFSAQRLCYPIRPIVALSEGAEQLVGAAFWQAICTINNQR